MNTHPHTTPTVDREAEAIAQARGAEQCKLLRQAYKRRGWSQRAISVRNDAYSMGSTMHVSIKDPAVVLDFAEVDRLANAGERIARCEYSGEILGGGNRYVDVGFSGEARDVLAAPLVTGCAAVLAKLLEDPGGILLHDLALVSDKGTGWLIGWDARGSQCITVIGPEGSDGRGGQFRMSINTDRPGMPRDRTAEWLAEHIGIAMHKAGMHPVQKMARALERMRKAPPLDPAGQGDAATDGETGGEPYSIELHKHSKTGADLWTVRLIDRVSRDRFDALRTSAKSSGGTYRRSYKPANFPGGFTFDSEAEARAWARSEFGGGDPGPDGAPAGDPAGESAEGFDLPPETEQAGEQAALAFINDGTFYAELDLSKPAPPADLLRRLVKKHAPRMGFASFSAPVAEACARYLVDYYADHWADAEHAAEIRAEDPPKCDNLTPPPSPLPRGLADRAKALDDWQASCEETLAKANKIRAMAERLEAQAEAKLAPRLENTPKRQREAGAARLEGHRMERAAAMLHGWADAAEAGKLPSCLLKPPTKAEALAAARKPRDTARTGYYDAPEEVCDPDAWEDQSPRADALRDLGGLTSAEGRARAEEQAQEAAKAAELAELRRSDLPGFFPTPEDLGRRMVELARLHYSQPIGDPAEGLRCEADSLEGLTVLDPSCGIGSLLELAAEAGATCYGIEVVPRLADFCQRHCAANMIECRDFLGIPLADVVANRCGFLAGSGIASCGADVVLMNPPFEKGAAWKHVRHAFRFVKPGGVLVAVMPENMRACMERGEDGNTHMHRFGDWLHILDHEWYDVEPGAFASARDSFRQTGVSVDLLVIRKPAAERELEEVPH